MAHFAELDSFDVVKRVVVIHNNNCLDAEGKESEQIGAEFCRKLFGGYNWVQTSYNGNFRKRFAGVGYQYDQNRDAFIPKKYFSSWVFNEDTCDWQAPIAEPNDGKNYRWDEFTQTWKEIK
jgi:hypothetical protein